MEKVFGECLSITCTTGCCSYTASTSTTDVRCVVCSCRKESHRLIGVLVNNVFTAVDNNRSLSTAVTPLGSLRNPNLYPRSRSPPTDNRSSSTTTSFFDGNPTNYASLNKERLSLFNARYAGDDARATVQASKKRSRGKHLKMITMERHDRVPTSESNYASLREENNIVEDVDTIEKKTFEALLQSSGLGERFADTRCYFLYTRKGKELIPTGFSHVKFPRIIQSAIKTFSPP